MSDKKKPKKVFIDGPISSSFIGDSIAKHQTKTSIGGHSIFLGQVREDELENDHVVAINFEAYEELAAPILTDIREAAFEKFDLTCMHIYHSLGRVAVGEICFFVFTSSPHRDACFEATRFIAEQVKSKVPIYGKEVLSNGKEVWKENTPAT